MHDYPHSKLGIHSLDTSAKFPNIEKGTPPQTLMKLHSRPGKGKLDKDKREGQTCARLANKFKVINRRDHTSEIRNSEKVKNSEQHFGNKLPSSLPSSQSLCE